MCTGFCFRYFDVSKTWYTYCMIELSALQLLIFSFFFAFGLLLFHNRFKKYLFSSILINVACVVGAAILITKPEEWALFIIASILNVLFDTAEVYRKKWQYNTESGYVYWAGLGWGFVTLIVKQLSTKISLPLLVVLALITLGVILSRNKSELNFSRYSKSTWLVFAVLALFISPQLFLVSFFIGILFEFIAVEVLHSWSYSSPIFILVGIGYGTLMVVIDVLLEMSQGQFSLVNVIFATGIIVFLARQYILYFISKNKTKKQVNTKSKNK